MQKDTSRKARETDYAWAVRRYELAQAGSSPDEIKVASDILRRARVALAS